MSQQALQAQFLQQLSPFYEKREAENIWWLVMEKTTGLPYRSPQTLDYPTDQDFTDRMAGILDRLRGNEPVQYVLEEAWFYDSPFYVDNRVLIPRPETEELVDWIIKDQSSLPAIQILDIGTGSGCIPITLKRKLPVATIYSCDSSAGALEVASRNARQLDATVQFLELDYLDPGQRERLPKVDLMVSNPPYIPETDQVEMAAQVLQFEPHRALFVKNGDPLVFYKALAMDGQSRLPAGGKIYMEIHEKQGAAVCQLFASMGYSVTLRCDLQGRDRMVRAIRQ